MPYTTLAKVKEKLRITTAEVDTMLTNIINEVDAEINAILSAYTHVPVADPLLTSVLDSIEAEWAAGLYRMLVEPQVLTTPEGQQREHVLITHARKRLDTLIQRFFAREIQSV
ncbi:MAG: hypothetical protein QW544_03555 [Candidatus Caldarchaeum sp.]